MRSSPARGAVPAADRRAQILAAARSVIEEFGPQAPIGRIADRVGLARPNFYRHFPSKEALDAAVARSAYQELRAAIRARIELTGVPMDVVRAPIAAQVAWASEHPNVYRFLVGHGRQQAVLRPSAARSAFAAELAAAGARYVPQFGVDPEAAEATMAGILGLVDASVLYWLDKDNGSREQLVETLTIQAWLIIDQRLRTYGVVLDPAAVPAQPRDIE